MPNSKLILDYVYDHEVAKPDEVFLVQPIGGGRVVEYTWRQMLGEARGMAERLNSRGFEPGARIAMLSKNCAHCFMVELAVWDGGWHHGGNLSHRKRRERALRARAQRGEPALRRQTRYLGEAGGCRACQPAMHRAAAGAADRLRDLDFNRCTYRAALRPPRT